jgi:hypothetical protein
VITSAPRPATGYFARAAMCAHGARTPKCIEKSRITQHTFIYQVLEPMKVTIR